MHLKGQTECFECSPKPVPKSFPVCTLRNTPDKPIHCVVWAKDMLFARMFGANDEVTGEEQEKQLRPRRTASTTHSARRRSAGTRRRGATASRGLPWRGALRGRAADLDERPGGAVDGEDAAAGGVQGEGAEADEERAKEEQAKRMAREDASAFVRRWVRRRAAVLCAPPTWRTAAAQLQCAHGAKGSRTAVAAPTRRCGVVCVRAQAGRGLAAVRRARV